MLEAEVLATLWAAEEPLTAEQVRRELASDLAPTTVTTVLSRLLDKGAVRRQVEGRAYAYAPVLDQAGLAARRMQVLLEEERDQAVVLNRFVAGLDRKGIAALRRALRRQRDGSR